MLSDDNGLLSRDEEINVLLLVCVIWYLWGVEDGGNDCDKVEWVRDVNHS